MKDNFTRHSFKKAINVEKIITIFYMEMPKSFHHPEERHDFWEMVYIDKGEMLCSHEGKRFILKSGEMTFHKPNELHNLSGNMDVYPNISIVTFVCRSKAMRRFEGKIFKLNSEEKALLSSLISEALSCYRLKDEKNPLLQNLIEIENAPLGSSQMTKNLLEIFLIKLCRRSATATKEMRNSIRINGEDIPFFAKEILDFLNSNIYERITIADISKALGKSESAIKQAFSKYRGGGIIRLFNSLKLQEARRLIKSGNYNISQISDMLKYDNPQYFAKCFKAETNMTPSEYRQSILK